MWENAPRERLAPSPQTIVLGWLEKEHRARVIIDSSQTIVWMNAAARKQLSAFQGVAPRHDRFAFAGTSEQRRFETYLGTLGAAMATIAIPLGEGRDHVLFRGSRIETERGAFACLEFTRDTPFSAAQYLDFESVFNLTAAEHRVALKLLDGHSAQAIAESLKVSIDTVRSQIRALYAKIGVSHREELFARLAPYCVM